MLARIRWLRDGAVKLAKDLFYGVGNQHLDLARVIAGLFAGMVAFAVYWNAIALGQAIDLSALLTGLAALAASIGGLVAAKDWVRSKFGAPPGDDNA